MKQIFKDIMTCKDGESFDIVRVSMAIMIFLLPLVLIWGIIMETLYSFGILKSFDMSGTFTSVMAFCAGAGAFLMSGSASLLFKKTTEPNGETNEVESITKGKQPDNNTTVINQL